MKYHRLLLLIIFFSSLAFAEDSPSENLIIVGTHLSGSIHSENRADVTITAEDIEALVPNGFADILRGIAGMDIVEQGGLGGLTFLSLRGGDPNFVVVLIDGVKVNDPTNSRGGAFDLGTIDPMLIEKIEVFYGSFSTVHGSDALAGIISITTKSITDGKRVALTVKTGSGDMKGAATHFTADVTDVGILSLAGSYQRGDNSRFSDDFKRKDLNLSLKSEDETLSPWRISSFYAEGEAKYYPEDSGGERLAVIRTPESRTFTQTNTAFQIQHQLTENSRFNFNSSWSKRKEDILSPGIAEGVFDAVPAIDSISNYQRFDLGSTINFYLSENLTTALGISRAEEKGGTDSIIDFGFPVPANYTLKRDNNAIFVEFASTKIDKLDITAGIRFDKSEEISIKTQRFVARYQLSKTNIVSAHYSTGFKLPSFFALAHPFVGNPDLKSERSKNYEVNLTSNFNEKLSSKVSFYENNYQDLVDFDPIAFTNVNRSKIRAKGTELSVLYNASEYLRLSGHISYLNIDTFDVNVTLRRRPEWKTAIEVNYQANETISMMIRYNDRDSYYDSSIATGFVTMQGLSRLDASMSWLINEDFTFRLGIKNFMNNDQEEALGFINQGRTISANLSLSL